jgi:hypothetical protein
VTLEKTANYIKDSNKKCCLQRPRTAFTLSSLFFSKTSKNKSCRTVNKKVVSLQLGERSEGLARTRTGVTRIRIWSDNHYTTKPVVTSFEKLLMEHIANYRFYIVIFKNSGDEICWAAAGLR